MIAALVATTLAASATVLGGFLALHPRMRRRGPLAFGLAFAAGLMLVLSLVEILPLSLRTLQRAAVGHPGWWTLGAFLVGAVVVLLIDLVVPEEGVAADRVTDPAAPTLVGPTGPTGGEPEPGLLTGDPRLRRSGLLIALVIGAHNAPEGLMTFLTMLEAPELGLGLVVAIAIHNVPEGIAVAAPLYAATGRRRLAVAWTAVAGLAEPVGALVGYFLLRALLPEQFLVLSLALVAGMMITLSLRELLPAARHHQSHPGQSLSGLLLGALVVWVSLLLAR